MRSLGIGVIGMGWMGHTHSRADRQLQDRFNEIGIVAHLICCADAIEERAKEGMIRHGFNSFTTDWKRL